MVHVKKPFPDRVKKLADGTLEKPLYSRTWDGLDKLIKRQQEKGWKMKGTSFLQDDFWCCVMTFKSEVKHSDNR